MAYPTYEVGARIAGCRFLAAEDPTAVEEAPALVWLNSPSNPTGEILSGSELQRRVDWARQRGAIVASDECYGEFGWDVEPTSVLHPNVSGDDHTDLLALFSLSKRSNLAGYRAGFVAGDGQLIAELLAVRKHAGMIPAAAGAGGHARAAGRSGRTSPSSVSGTAGDARCCGRLWRPPASPSSTRRVRSTCGPPAGRAAGTRSPGWPTAASWWLPGTSTERRPPSSYAWD